MCTDDDTTYLQYYDLDTVSIDWSSLSMVLFVSETIIFLLSVLSLGNSLHDRFHCDQREDDSLWEVSHDVIYRIQSVVDSDSSIMQWSSSQIHRSLPSQSVEDWEQISLLRMRNHLRVSPFSSSIPQSITQFPIDRSPSVPPYTVDICMQPFPMRKEYYPLE